VVRASDVTPVPGVPSFVLGVTNLRGEIVAVLDLRALFDLPARGLTDLARLIVVGAGQPEFGLLVDETREIRSLPRAALLPPPGSLSGIGRESLLGVTDAALVVLDGAALLADTRLYVEHTPLPGGGEADR
jgi:purine-binding chemotaxis protein CheW